MGTSFVEFNGHGFWTRDPLVEALLGGIVVELEEAVEDHPWLGYALDHWALHATAGFGGCVSPDLDWYLAEADRVALVCEASRRSAARITRDDLHEVSSDAFERRAARVLGKPWDGPPSAGGGWRFRPAMDLDDVEPLLWATQPAVTHQVARRPSAVASRSASGVHPSARVGVIK